MNRKERRLQAKAAKKAGKKINHHGILGEQLAHQGKTDEAIAAFHRALETDSKYADGHFNLGILYRRQGKFEDSVASYERAIAIKPKHFDAHYNLGNVLTQVGKLDEAIASFRKTVSIKPDFAEAHNNLGNLLKELGRLDEAANSLNKAVKVKPDYAEAQNNLGSVLKEQGRMDEALDSFREALAIKSDFAEAHSNLGSTLFEMGNLDEAIESCRKAISLKPDYVQGHINLGNVLFASGEREEAITSFKKALAFNPESAEAHNSLGSALMDQGNPEEALASFRKALNLKPDYAQAHFNLGNMLKEQHLLDEASESYLNAVAFKPDYVEAFINLGGALKDLKKLDEAAASLQKAITLHPNHAEAHNNLGNILKDQNNLKDAEASYRKALEIRPDYADAHYNLGDTLQEQGKIDAATIQFDQALSHKPDAAGWRIRRALLLPVIPYSDEDIGARRENLIEAVRDLHKQSIKLPDPTVVGSTNFYLTYHNKNNRRIMEDIAQLYIAAFPELTYEAPHCGTAKSAPKERLRIGFLSSFFWEHTIGKLSRGIIEHLSREKFEVIVFRLPGMRDAMSEAIEQTADKIVQLHKKLDEDRDILAGEELDILFYPDIGMDPYTYFLAFARLAPVQAITWGHPDTTGIPNIDYFLSSDLLEPTETSEQYTEQLAQLPLLPTYYFRPELPENTFARTDYGLPDNGALYVCPQTLFKFHPNFDTLIGDLLRRDPEGHLVLIDDGKGGYWNTLLKERIGRVCPEIIDRIVFVPRMSNEKFLGLLLLADALLDIPTFSGGNSSQEAFAMGAPIVTWPSNFMRGRVTAGCYNQMGLSDLIASDGEEYVSLALKLAHDSDFKRRMQDEIKANSHKLFERMEVVREMEDFFVRAYEASIAS